MPNEKADRIKQRAHKLWEQEGRPEGRDRHHWEEAERQILAEDEGGSARKRAAKQPEAKKPAVAKASAAKPPAAKSADPGKVAEAPKRKRAPASEKSA